MGVESLRATKSEGMASEFKVELHGPHNFIDKNDYKVARAAITAVLLWFTAWTPYVVISIGATFGFFVSKNLKFIDFTSNFKATPVVSQVPVIAAKAASCINPVLFAFSHPKYRNVMLPFQRCFPFRFRVALGKYVPWLGVGRAEFRAEEEKKRIAREGGTANEQETSC